MLQNIHSEVRESLGILTLLKSFKIKFTNVFSTAMKFYNVLPHRRSQWGIVLSERIATLS